MKLILLLVNLVFVLGYPQDKNVPPKFSEVYSVKGTLYIPFAEVREPFFAWYDSAGKRSRVDYYGGMVKTYQLGAKGEHGDMMKVVPVTTDEELNKITCLENPGAANMPVTAQSVLPDVSDFKYLGDDMVKGIVLEKWRLLTSEGDKVSKYTLWVRYSQDENKFPIPVRYEMKGYNSLLGSHFDHYYIEYETYSPEKPDDKFFTVDKDLKCQPFPGPGENHMVTFNPMMEFINNERTHIEAEFTKFKRQHGRNYESDLEHEKRQTTFMHNLRFIHSTNRAGKSYTVAINHLADKTDAERKALRGFKHSRDERNALPFPHKNIKKSDYPESLDWTLYGAVTPVKDQSVCGSCWSFGTTGAVEGAYFMKHKKLAVLSEQALVDCSWGYGNNGCDGGEDFRSYKWMLKHGGLPTEDDYGQYLGQDGFCHIDNVTKTAPITGFVDVTHKSPEALKLACSKYGPISVAIDASVRSFSFYSNGVYYDDECKNTEDGLDHAVLLVGYGNLNGTDYWQIKNSWSTYWGNQGYVLMSLKNNNCGVTLSPTYVTM